MHIENTALIDYIQLSTLDAVYVNDCDQGKLKALQ